MGLFKRSIILLIGGYLFLGISHIAFLPPWEGFDETAHFSYIQQLADIGSLPKLKDARFSKDVEEYAKYAPMPYTSVPPFEKNGGYTYKSFFGSHPRIVREGHSYVYGHPRKTRHFTPGTVGNWQAQHPPLYYALLYPFYKATRSSALIDQIFLLRIVSYFFAWSALVISICGGVYFFRLHPRLQNSTLQHWLAIGAAAIPIFFPAWFPEMARIGNDSLCALLLSVLWLFFLRTYFRGFSIKISIAIGLIMGLGCLTKAFFIPVSIGMIICLLLQSTTRKGIGLRGFFLHLTLILMIIFAISGWWYLRNWLATGTLIGSLEMADLKKSVVMLEGLRKHFSIIAWLRAHAAIVATLAWSCTWSLARPPYVFLAPLVLNVLFTIFSYLGALRHHRINEFAWSAFWFAMPVAAGLSYHVLVRIALSGEGRGTPGYYLLFMVPVIGTTLGIGLQTLWQKRKFRIAVALAGIYAVAFSIVISWAQVLMFSGIIYKSGHNKFYQLPEALPHYLGLPEAMARLSAFSYPKLGVFCWILGGVLLVLGLSFGWRFINRLEKKTNLPKPGAIPSKA